MLLVGRVSPRARDGRGGARIGVESDSWSEGVGWLGRRIRQTPGREQGRVRDHWYLSTLWSSHDFGLAPLRHSAF